MLFYCNLYQNGILCEIEQQKSFWSIIGGYGCLLSVYGNLFAV